MLKGKLTVRELCQISVFTAIIIVMAQISIPMPLGVPMTMQTFAISLAGMLLGSKKAFLASLVYILLGAFGLPVFAGFRGGFGVIVGAAGGFILSFPLMALLIGLGAENIRFKSAPVIGMTVGTVLNYVCGLVMFSAVTGNSISVSFTACVLPFIPTAIVKAVVACALGVKIRARGVLIA